MSVLAPPAAIDPLIAEAKERARRRRLLLASLAIGVAAVAGATVALRSSERPRPAVLAPSTCRPRQLRLSAPAGWGGAAGSLLEPMTLTNASGSACSLAGWPAVRRLGRGGRVIPGRVFLYTYSDIASVPFHRVTLQPGHAASFNFFGPDYEIVANRSCPNTRKLEVKLPGAHGWLSIARKIPACAVLYVDPLVPGRTDRRWGGVGIQHFAHP